MRIDRRQLLSALSRLSGVRVAVVGDLIADVLIYARPVGLSREAPVMILREESRTILPGGGANAAHNVLALTGRASCVGIVGGDAAGRALEAFLTKRGADGRTIVRASGAATYTKTRVLAGDVHTVKQQVFRLDNEPASRMTAAVERRVLSAIERAARTADAWLVSDYDGDMFSPRVVARLNRLAAARRVVVVDSHSRLSRFSKVTCATPNESEASAEAQLDIVDDGTAVEAGRRIRRKMRAQWVFVTRGNKGMTIVGPGKSAFNLPIVGTSDIVDVAGAGDTVSAVVTLALANGERALTAGLLASYAASVVCMKTGVATATAAEVEIAIKEYPLPKM